MDYQRVVETFLFGSDQICYLIPFLVFLPTTLTVFRDFLYGDITSFVVDTSTPRSFSSLVTRSLLSVTIMKGNNSPTRIDMAGQKSKSRAQTRPDLERGMNSTPPRKQKPSPTKTIPMTPDTPQRVVIDVNGNGNRGGGR